jgi:RNA polymerase sigma-70 factor, ECF subfamily
MNAKSENAVTSSGADGPNRRDPLVFSELLSDSRARLFGYLLALVQNTADAEDVYQHTALLLWEKFDEFELGTDFGAWAMTVAHYTAMNFLRRQSRRKWLFSQAATARLAAVNAEMRAPQANVRLEALDNCIGGLPSHERSLLWSRYQGQKSIEDIAEQESRTVGSVYKALSRLRIALLACIERRLAQETP